jgi:hypothetical protein
MSEDIVQRLRQAYDLADVAPDHILRRACDEIERLRAELAQQRCPYIRSSSEGTHWCALAAQPAQSAEPVAWIDDSEHPKHRLYRQSARERRLYGPLRPLYLHPAPDHREAMRLALEALEICADETSSGLPLPAIGALRAALRDDK